MSEVRCAAMVDTVNVGGFIPPTFEYKRRLSNSSCNALDNADEIKDQVKGKRVIVFLDYDGTLTPIVDDPDRAVMAEEMRELLRRLCARFTVAIVTGRSLKKISEFVRLDSVYYAGSHGFDIVGPKGNKVEFQVAHEWLPALNRAFEMLKTALDAIPGVMIENSHFSISVHYRHVDPASVPTVESHVDQVLAQLPELKKTFGKKVFELKPQVHWNKGAAVLWLLNVIEENERRRHEMSEAIHDGAHVASNKDHKQLSRQFSSIPVAPVYCGDDVTDEDAFAALQKKDGVTLLVTEESKDTCASYTVRNPHEVAEFLDYLIELADQGLIVTDQSNPAAAH